MSCDIKINEAVTFKLEVKPIVTMAKGDKTFRMGYNTYWDTNIDN